MPIINRLIAHNTHMKHTFLKFATARSLSTPSLGSRPSRLPENMVHSLKENLEGYSDTHDKSLKLGASQLEYNAPHEALNRV